MKTLYFAGLLLISSSCSTIYYNFWETFGQEKRDLLQRNVNKANKEQKEVKEQFQEVLERVKSEYSFEGGELEETYEDLLDDYNEASERSAALSNRVDKVEDIGKDLFKEWKSEARELGNKKYREDSLNKLERTQKEFNNLLASMRSIESNLEKTLKGFHDQVIYLKHNLNAKAIGSFRGEFKSIEREMENLVKEITRSSKEAEEFIRTL